MTFLAFAAVLIIIAVILKFWIQANLEEGFLGKGFMIIIVILVIVGLLQVFGVLPAMRGWG